MHGSYSFSGSLPEASSIPPSSSSRRWILVAAVCIDGFNKGHLGGLYRHFGIWWSEAPQYKHLPSFLLLPSSSVDTHLARGLVALSSVPVGAQSISSVKGAATGVAAGVHSLYNTRVLLILWISSS